MIKNFFSKLQKAINAPIDPAAAAKLKALEKREQVLDGVIGAGLLGGLAYGVGTITGGKSPLDTGMIDNHELPGGITGGQALLGVGLGAPLLTLAAGVGLLGLGKVGRMRAGALANAVGQTTVGSPLRFLGSMGAAGNIRKLGFADYVGATAAAIGKEIGGVAAPLERAARYTILGPVQARRGAAAWFPYFNKAPADDLRKYALNPRVGTMMLGGAGLLGAASYASNYGGLSDRVKTPQTQFYHDGTSLRHMNDLGADHSYGQKVMGAASNQFQRDRYNEKRGLY